MKNKSKSVIFIQSQNLYTKGCLLVLFLLFCVNFAFGFNPTGKKQSQIIGKYKNTKSFLEQKNTMSTMHKNELISKAQVFRNNKFDINSSIKQVFNEKLGKYGCKIVETRRDVDKYGITHIRFQQYFKDMKILGGDMVVHVSKDNQILGVNGKTIHEYPKDLAKNSINASEAVTVALSAVEDQGVIGDVEKVEKVVYSGQVVYEVYISGTDKIASRWRCLIDCETSEIIHGYNTIKYGPPGSIGEHLPVTGNLLDGEGGGRVEFDVWKDDGGNYFLYHKINHWFVYDSWEPDWVQQASNDWGTSDQAAYSLANNMRITQDYVRTVMGRNSYDNTGAMADCRVHIGNEVNAYWDDYTESFHFGDGDGVEADELCVLDITAHEFGHAITTYTSDLVYSYEPGALNEAYSDIFGTLVEFWGQTDGRTVYPAGLDGQSDWLCGEDAWLSSEALRDLRDPQRFGQPSRYKGTNWWASSGDNGGVHTNSGVANFAFYLLAEGGAGTNDGLPYSITGLGIEVAGEIAMYANMYLHTRSDGYEDARNAWVQAAQILGYNAETVSDVWRACGVVPMVKNIDVLQTSYDFGNVGTGQSEKMSVTLVNNGGIDTYISDISTDNTKFSYEIPFPSLVPAMGTVSFDIFFNPDMLSSETGILTISSDAADNPDLNVFLSGVGVEPPVPDIESPFLSLALYKNQSSQETITISNSGEADLKYSLNAKNTGGYAYHWKDSNDPDGPAYVWNNISETGTLLPHVSDCDNCNDDVEIGFPFNYYGTDYNSLRVSSNGYVTFEIPPSLPYNHPLPSKSAPPNMIAGFHDNINTKNGGEVYFQQDPNKVTIQYNRVNSADFYGYYTFQIVLHSSGKIFLYYNDMYGDLTKATIGIQNGSRDAGVEIAYNESYVHDMLAVEISRSQWLMLTPETGVVAAGETEEITLNFDATNLLDGVYYETLQISHNGVGLASPYDIPIDMLLVNLYPPVMINPLSDQVVQEGNTATFNFEVTGDDLTFVWRVNEELIEGATSASYTTPPLTMADNENYYHVMADNEVGTADFAAKVTVNPAPPAGLENIAVGKTVKAKTEYSIDYSAVYVNDGDPTTSWGSSTENQYEWIYIDLGKVEAIEGIRVNWHDPYYATRFKIGISNDATNWNYVYLETDGLGGIKDYLATYDCQYVGIFFTEKNKTAVGLKELEVYKKEEAQ